MQIPNILFIKSGSPLLTRDIILKRTPLVNLFSDFFCKTFSARKTGRCAV